jgi:ATP-dependent protease ClpP protease subunit
MDKMTGNILIGIPESVANYQLPDPELLTYYKNIDNRVIWLDTGVDDMWLEYEKQIIEWNREDIGLPIEERRPIKLMFFSYGGQIDINYSFIDLIQKSKTPIWGVNMGQACSAACFIFIACHKRFAMPRSSYLIHQGGVEGGFSGTYEQVVAAIMEYQRQIEELGQYLLQYTNITEEMLNEKFDSEWYLTAEEAIKLGVADKIVDDIDDIL